MNTQAKPPARPVRLRDIALLLVGGLIAGIALGLIAVAAARFFTHSKFVLATILGCAIYGCLLIAYQWLAKDRGWDSLQARFSRTRLKPIVAAAASGIGLTVLISAVADVLRWLGIDVVPLPTPNILPRNATQLIFALGLIAFLGPLAEELIFRGLLLDWLKLKINVWAAALILSVIFALMHNNGFRLVAIGALAFAVRMALGLASSAFVIRYSSLRPSFVMHATFNGAACVVSVLISP
jgi:membrane protease YdiL (CAAX protease family)